MEKYILERNLKGIYQDITDDNKKINKEVKNNIITYFKVCRIILPVHIWHCVARSVTVLKQSPIELAIFPT